MILVDVLLYFKIDERIDRIIFRLEPWEGIVYRCIFNSFGSLKRQYV